MPERKNRRLSIRPRRAAAALALLFLSLTNVCARAEDRIPLSAAEDDEQSDNLRAIPLYSKARCREIMTPLVAPENVIKKGLAALAGGGPSAHTLGCIEEIVTTFDTYLPPPEEIPEDENGLPVNREKLELIRSLKKIRRKMACYNKHPPGTSAAKAFEIKWKKACSGKWITKEEMASLLKQKQEGQAKLELFNAKERFRDNSIQELVKARLPVLKYQSPKLNALRAALEKTASSEEEAQARQAAYETELAAYNQKIPEELKALEELVRIARIPEAHARLNVAKVTDLYTRSRCAKLEKAPAQGATETENDDNDRAYCKSLPPAALRPAPPEKSLPAVFAKLLPDPKAFVKKWTADETSIAELRQKRKNERSEEMENRYGIRRLLAGYGFYAKRHGAAASLDQFCEENEASQKEDLAYAGQMKRIRPFESAEHWRYARETGISEAELSALREYTSSFFQEINPAIWRATAAKDAVPLDEKLDRYRRMMNHALDRLPAFRADPVKRFTDLPEAALAEHQVGAVVTYQAYTSTSRAKDWQWTGKHRFVIYGGQNGKDIGKISEMEREEEILFKAGTRFKVLSRQEGENGVVNFVMAEVDDSGQVIAEVPAAAIAPESPGPAPAP